MGTIAGDVLRAIADSIATAIKGHNKPKAIMFHRAREKPNIQPQRPPLKGNWKCILANSWSSQDNTNTASTRQLLTLSNWLIDSLQSVHVSGHQRLRNWSCRKNTSWLWIRRIDPWANAAVTGVWSRTRNPQWPRAGYIAWCICKMNLSTSGSFFVTVDTNADSTIFTEDEEISHSAKTTNHYYTVGGEHSTQQVRRVAKKEK